MTPEFAEPVNRIFDYVLDLVDQIENNERPDLDQEKENIRIYLDGLTENSGKKPGQKIEDLELVQRALIYWVDEVLTNANLKWKDMTLEVDYFGEKERAWRFYEFGERRARVSSPDVIETWYLCLVLGFDGDIVEAFRDHLHLQLPGGANDSSQAKKAWASELVRLIRKPTFADLKGEPIAGGIEPLVGAGWLQTVLICLAIVTLIGGALLTIHLKFKSQA